MASQRKSSQSLEAMLLLSCLRRTFPAADLGMEFVKTTFLTFLYGATCHEKTFFQSYNDLVIISKASSQQLMLSLGYSKRMKCWNYQYMNTKYKVNMEYLFSDIIHNSCLRKSASMLLHYKCHWYLPRFFIQDTGGKKGMIFICKFITNYYRNFKQLEYIWTSEIDIRDGLYEHVW